MKCILLITLAVLASGCNKVGSTAFAPGTKHRIANDKALGCDLEKGLATLDELRASGNRIKYEDWRVSNCTAFDKDEVVTIADRNAAKRYVGVSKDGDSRVSWMHASDIQ